MVAEPPVQRVYEQLINQLDKRRPQVLIECTLVTLDTSRNFTFGVDIGTTIGGGASEMIMFSSWHRGNRPAGAGARGGRVQRGPTE